MLGLIAAAVYLLVTVSCLWAAFATDRRPHGVRRARSIWLTIGMLFVLLAASRGIDFEDQFRGALRSWLVAEGEYGQRRALQGPLAAALVAVGGAAGIALVLRIGTGRRDRASRALVVAMRAAMAMIGLVALRLVSFHPTDALLYEARLNWVFDLGLSLLVLGAAVAFRLDGRHPGNLPGGRRAGGRSG